MGLEFDTEVSITEDFSDYTLKVKLELILAILLNKEWEFIGTDTVFYEPPDYP